MCEHCWGWDDWDCHGWHRYPGYHGYYGRREHGQRWRYYEESSPEERQEDLEAEKRALERRLKELEAMIGEASKQ